MSTISVGSFSKWTRFLVSRLKGQTKRRITGENHGGGLGRKVRGQTLLAWPGSSPAGISWQNNSLLLGSKTAARPRRRPLTKAADLGGTAKRTPWEKARVVEKSRKPALEEKDAKKKKHSQCIPVKAGSLGYLHTGPTGMNRMYRLEAIQAPQRKVASDQHPLHTESKANNAGEISTTQHAAILQKSLTTKQLPNCVLYSIICNWKNKCKAEKYAADDTRRRIRLPHSGKCQVGRCQGTLIRWYETSMHCFLVAWTRGPLQGRACSPWQPNDRSAAPCCRQGS